LTAHIRSLLMIHDTHRIRLSLAIIDPSMRDSSVVGIIICPDFAWIYICQDLLWFLTRPGLYEAWEKLADHDCSSTAPKRMTNCSDAGALG
jgi:hypothetical protein